MKAQKTWVRVAEWIYAVRCADLAVLSETDFAGRTKGLHASKNFEPKLPFTAMMWSARNEISQFLVNLPPTNALRGISFNANTFGLWHLQIPEVASGSGPPDRTSVLQCSTHVVMDRQFLLLGRGTNMPSLLAVLFPTWLTCTFHVSWVSSVTTRYRAVGENALLRVFGCVSWH
jgi:hypothetical protein